MEKLKLDDFTKYKFLSGISMSSDGKNCGFIVHQSDVEENKYLSNIYILDEENKIMKLTSLDEEKSFIWRTDTSILFPAIRNKKDRERKEKGKAFTTYYEISINGGEAQKSFEIPINVTSIKKIDEDNFILTATFDPLTEDLKEKKDYVIIDEIPFWSNGEDNYTNKKRNRLYTYDVKNNLLKMITDEFSNVEDYSISRDRKFVAFITSSYIDKMSTNTELNLYSIEENKYEKISPFQSFNYSHCDFLGDNIVFIGNNMQIHGINQNPNIYITDFTGYTVDKISDFDCSTWNSVGSDCRYGSSRSAKVDGDYLYYTTTEGANSFIHRIDINGNSEKLSSPNGSIDGFDVVNGKIYFIGLRYLKLQEIYLLNTKETQLTHFNSWVMKEKKLSTPEKLLFKLEDEKQIEGWVLKPVDYEEDKTYPAILNIHGGPKTVFGEVFFHEMQYWANEGYFVFYCNPRGSDGYGDEFSDIRGQYGTIDYDDIMDFTDLVLMNYPSIDEDRLGVTGGSYGGFMTNWIIGHTSRFKAAVSQRSISNWISFFGTSDIGYYFADDQVASTPWDNVEKMWFHSPLKYADNVITPTLFIHSEEDYRCWIPEGLQMFTALKYHGVESRLVAFKGENHDLSRSGKPKNRIKRLEEITAWFDKYLK
ncbi:S9 family peptidase [Tissierella sp. Yu-01]|uniref:S9 family peptidase n=1 Tax=Tissierella sp. Yu-01 TaxID=3035694 RepID=UPI00240E39EC|nr:S9 family peptidase [Tissierella sp. Yu-01]WFA08704.1 S9 family peptidase [Tissierella sp. Yu-01]